MGQPPRHLPTDLHAGLGLVVANLFLLLVISFLPLPAKILGEQLGNHGPDQTAAMIFYNACFLVVAGFFQPGVVPHLPGRPVRARSKEAVARITRRYRLGVPSYLVATVVAVWSVPVSLAIDTGLALLYIVLPGAAIDADQAPAGA